MYHSLKAEILHLCTLHYCSYLPFFAPVVHAFVNMVFLPKQFSIRLLFSSTPILVLALYTVNFIQQFIPRLPEQ